MEIKEAITEDEIKDCYAVLKTLRVHFTDISEFVPRVWKQQQDGYHLIYVKDEGEVQELLVIASESIWRDLNPGM